MKKKFYLIEILTMILYILLICYIGYIFWFQGTHKCVEEHYGFIVCGYRYPHPCAYSVCDKWERK